MKYLIPFLFFLPACGFIPTSNDLRELAFELDKVTAIAEDNTKDSGDLTDALVMFKASVDNKLDELDERGQGLIQGLGQGAEGGILSLALVLGMNAYRNSTRKKALAGKKDEAPKA